MIGAAVLALMPNGDGKTPRLVALLVSCITLLLSIALFSQYRPETPGFQLSEYASWIPALGVSYSLGLDGLSLMLVILTTLLTFVAVVFGGQTKVGGKALLALVLVLETGGLVGIAAVLAVTGEAPPDATSVLYAALGGISGTLGLVCFFVFGVPATGVLAL
jgi:NADH:ubiquinone oxidoreductase subunit 4 (subunit M)